MEEQSSILMQKKIILGICFLFLFTSYVYANYDLNISNNMEFTIAENSLISDEDIVLSQNVTYTALTEVAEDLVFPNDLENTSGESLDKVQINNIETSQSESIHPTNTEDIQTTQSVQNVVSTSAIPFWDNNDVPENYKNVLSMNATAYCLCKKCCGKSASHPQYGVTASGYRITPGNNEKIIAVDTSVIPLGTKVFVEGLNGANNYGYAIAADTGSAIKNMKIDLYMDSHEDALRWGFKTVNVYLIEE